MRLYVSSLHQRPPNFLTGRHSQDDLLLREWLLVLRGDGKSLRTLEGYSDAVRQLAAFLKLGGFPPMTGATAEHIREWLNSLRERGNKPATVNTRYRAVSAFYQWLVKEGEIRENPVARIEPPRVAETVQVYYEAQEVEAVLRALRGRRVRGVDAARMRAIVVVLFDTGLRASELCGLKVADLNWDNQTILVRRGKGGDDRVVSLGTTAMRAVAGYLRVRAVDSPWLVATLEGDRLSRNALRLALRRAFEAAAVPFKGIHAFRRASGIAYLRQGGQAEDLRVLMGWRSPEMVRRYVKAAEVERATAAHKKFSPADGLDI